MKIILCGYGKMGHEVEAICLKRGHKIIARIDPQIPEADAQSLTAEHARQAEVIIEFALPAGIEERVLQYANFNLAAVIATTGWQDKKEKVAQIVKNSNCGLVYGSNFSLGANLFFEIIRQATRLTTKFSEYDVLAYELHHKRKKDSPSGTALTTAECILKESQQKKKIVTEKLDRAIADEELHFASVRGGYIPGTHTVLFDSEADTIEITHRARSRAGFALGSVLAAEWILGKKGFFEFSDFIHQLICQE